MNNHVLQILITDDDEGDRKQIKRAIGQCGLAAECTETASIKDALAACDGCEFDCAIVDYRLPGEDGLEGITALHGRLPHMAIIMSTGQGDEMVAAEAMKRGAADYILKSRINPATVQRAIQNAFEKCALQRRVIQQQQELENFARVLAHDLKAPAASIESFATRIGERLREGNLEKALQSADWVIQTARRMNRLIDTLHRYTMADVQVDFEAVEMNHVFESAQANLHQSIEECGASVTADTLPPVYGNAPQLIQFLQNLIANALKFCDKPVACIHVSARHRVASGSDAASWLFSVADNGIGIPKAQHKWIFEPFTRLTSGRDRDGTGLGLASCKKLIERHGGTIWCESQPDSGTTFFFTLQAVCSRPDRISTVVLVPL
jgi:light-regulated signal transduction histidine kinase (bacteriophytochrome)